MFLTVKMKNYSLTEHIFQNLQNHPPFHSVERFVDLERGGERFVCLSILLVNGYYRNSQNRSAYAMQRLIIRTDCQRVLQLSSFP